jgi:serine/threonine protein kinase
MTSPSLSALVVRWAEAHEQGQTLTAEQLCPDRPELVEELARRIDELRRLRVAAAAATLPPDPAGALPAPPTLSVSEALPPAAPAAVPGYAVERELGKGAQGVVYLARQEGLGRLVALKMLRTGPLAGREQRERLLREARLAARLDHPGIVAIHAVGEHQGRPFLALEYLAGGSLEKRLGKPWPIAEAARLVEGLARAARHAHLHGIVHRDLKPANVLLAEDGAAKVADFGLARHPEDSGGTHTGDLMGTPRYMAPEQAAGRSREVGPATDVHALGAILYELLTGKPAFSGGNLLEILQAVRDRAPTPPRRMRRDVPPELEAICLRCLEKDPVRRYPDAETLANELKRFLETGQLASSRGRRWLAPVALAVCGALLTALTFLLSTSPTDRVTDEGARQGARGEKRAPGILEGRTAPAQLEKRVVDREQANTGTKSVPGPDEAPPSTPLPRTRDDKYAAETLEATFVRQAKVLIQHFKGNGYKNVGVLKFLIAREGEKKFSDSVGTLNMLLARRLEVALVLANDERDPVGIIRNASAVAARTRGANHRTPTGRKKLFEPDYKLAWGNTTVKADAFVTGIAQISKDLQTLKVSLFAFDKARTKFAQVGEDFEVRNDAAKLGEMSESFVLRGGFDDEQLNPEEAVKKAASVKEKEAKHPLSGTLPVTIEVLYDREVVRIEQRDGRAWIPEPREGQKVAIRLRRDNAKVTYGVVLKVNGESTLFRQKLPDLQCRKWILPPGVGPLTVSGFQIDNNTKEVFRVMSRKESEARAIDYGDDVGTITLTVFRARQKEEAYDPTERKELRNARVVAQAKLPQKSTYKDLKSELLAESNDEETRGLIGEGEKEKSKVKTVSFKPDPTPLMSVTIVYYLPTR